MVVDPSLSACCSGVSSAAATSLHIIQTQCFCLNPLDFINTVDVYEYNLAPRYIDFESLLKSHLQKTTSLEAKVVKVSPGQTAKWQQLPKSTRLHLDSMMNWLIVSLLYENTESHRETERHLKLLKKRLLKHFETLKVPVEKMSYLQNARKILAKDKKQCESLEEGLTVLQEELDEAAKAATQREENIQSLHNKILELKRELVAEGKRASKLFQIDGSDDLALPKLSKHSIEAPLFQ
ncbi:hypothetical protein lerEdw1_018645, partial [Lerista edwardsae]